MSMVARALMLLTLLTLSSAVDGSDPKKLLKPVSILCGATCVRRGFAATKLVAVDEGPGFNELVQHLRWTLARPAAVGGPA